MPKRNPGARLEWREDRKTREIIFYDRGARKRQSTGTGDRNEAEKQLASYLHEKHRAFIGPCDPAQRLIGDVLADYGSEHGGHVAAPETLSYCIQACRSRSSPDTSDMPTAAQLSESTPITPLTI